MRVCKYNVIWYIWSHRAHAWSFLGAAPLCAALFERIFASGRLYMWGRKAMQCSAECTTFDTLKSTAHITTVSDTRCWNPSEKICSHSDIPGIVSLFQPLDKRWVELASDYKWQELWVVYAADCSGSVQENSEELYNGLWRLTHPPFTTSLVASNIITYYICTYTYTETWKCIIITYVRCMCGMYISSYESNGDCLKHGKPPRVTQLENQCAGQQFLRLWWSPVFVCACVSDPVPTWNCLWNEQFAWGEIVCVCCNGLCTIPANPRWHRATDSAATIRLARMLYHVSDVLKQSRSE